MRFRAFSDAEVPAVAGVQSTSITNGLVELRTQDPTRVLHGLTSWAVASGRTLEGIEVARPSLEDVYLELTGHAQPAPEEDAGAAEPARRRRGRRR